MKTITRLSSRRGKIFNYFEQLERDNVWNEKNENSDRDEKGNQKSRTKWNNSQQEDCNEWVCWSILPLSMYIISLLPSGACNSWVGAILSKTFSRWNRMFTFGPTKSRILRWWREAFVHRGDKIERSEGWTLHPIDKFGFVPNSVDVQWRK